MSLNICYTIFAKVFATDFLGHDIPEFLQGLVQEFATVCRHAIWSGATTPM